MIPPVQKLNAGIDGISLALSGAAIKIHKSVKKIKRFLSGQSFVGEYKESTEWWSEQNHLSFSVQLLSLLIGGRLVL